MSEAYMTSENLVQMRNLINGVNNMRSYLPDGFSIDVDIPIRNKDNKLVGRIIVKPSVGAVYVPAQDGYQTYEAPNKQKDER